MDSNIKLVSNTSITFSFTTAKMIIPTCFTITGSGFVMTKGDIIILFIIPKIDLPDSDQALSSFRLCGGMNRTNSSPVFKRRISFIANRRTPFDADETEWKISS